MDAVLIHEMIHVYFISIGEFTESHGYRFVAKAHQISDIVGFKIPIKDEIEEFGVAKDVKPISVILVKKSSGEYAFSIINEVLNPIHIEETMKYCKNVVFRSLYGTVEISMFHVKSDIWGLLSAIFPVQRITLDKLQKGTARMKFYKLQDNTLKNKTLSDIVTDLHSNGKLLGKITKADL